MTTLGNEFKKYLLQQLPNDTSAIDNGGLVFVGTNALDAYVKDSGVLIPVMPSWLIAKSMLVSRGDIIYASDASTPERLARGTDGQVLTLASGVPSWANVQMGSWTGHSDLTFYDANGIVFHDGGSISYAGNYGMDIEASGSISLNPNGPIYANSAIDCVGTVTAAGFINTSDRRAKEHIEDVRLSLEDMEKIPLAAFAFKTDAVRRRHVGTYAQDVQKVLPEAVHEGRGGTLGVDYNTLDTALCLSLVREVADLKRKVEGLESELSKLKNNGNK